MSCSPAPTRDFKKKEFRIIQGDGVCANRSKTTASLLADLRNCNQSPRDTGKALAKSSDIFNTYAVAYQTQPCPKKHFGGTACGTYLVFVHSPEEKFSERLEGPPKNYMLGLMFWYGEAVFLTPGANSKFSKVTVDGTLERIIAVSSQTRKTPHRDRSLGEKSSVAAFIVVKLSFYSAPFPAAGARLDFQDYGEAVSTVNAAILIFPSQSVIYDAATVECRPVRCRRQSSSRVGV